jgi:hypothetical protein
MDTKVCQIMDMKQSEENGKFYISGYANNKNKPDSYGDIPTNLDGEKIYILDRMDSNPVCFVDHRSSASNIAGNFVELREDDTGLFFKLLFRPLEDIHNPPLKDAVSAYMNGYGRALSIGGRWFFGDPKNPDHLTQAVVNEISLVGIGADMDALTDVSYPKHFKTVLPFKDLPIADRKQEWNDTQANKRIRTFSILKEGENQTDEIFGKAFVWRKEKNKCHYLQIADVIDGKLTVVPKALFLAAASLPSFQKETKVSDDEIKAIQEHINKYYKKLGMESPFGKSTFRIDDLSLDSRTMEKLLKSGVSFNDKMSKKIISSLKSYLQRDVEDKGERDANEWGDIFTSINNINKEIEKNAGIHN